MTPGAAFALIVSRHPRHVALGSLVTGLVLSGTPSLAVACGAAAVPLVGLLSRRALLAVICGALVLAGAWIGIVRRAAIDRSELGSFVGHSVSARGHLVKRERSISGTYRARVRLTALAVRSTPQRWREVGDLVQVQTRPGRRYPDLGIGEEVFLQGTLGRPAERVRGSFDYSAYLRRAGVHGLLRADSIIATGRRRGGPARVVDGLRRRAEAGVGAGLEPRLAALALGIVLGQDERIAHDMVDDFKAAGLAHLLAVSGQNVTLLAVLALPLLAASGLGRRARLVAVLALIAVYVPLTGAGPSILRAGAMGAAGTLALLSGRPASRWYGLLLAAALTLGLDPRAWLDVGWQLSFAAVVGIFWLVPLLRPLLERLPRPLAEGAALTLSATIATAPLMAFHFERVSVVSLLANLVALPAVAPIMWIGMLAAAVSQVSAPAAALLNGLNGFLLAYLAVVARWSAGLPSAVVSVKVGSPLVLCAAYAVPAIVIPAFLRMRRRLAPARFSGRQIIIILAATAALLAVIAWGLRPHAGDPPKRFTVSFLDVGQGDATLLQAPGETALVDGGPLRNDLVGKLRELGVRSLDVVVLTHAQADHEDGLEAVVREFPVGLLVDGGRGAEVETHDRIIALAHERGARVIGGRAGTVLRLGGMRLKLLSPEQGSLAAAGDEPNDRAVVLIASYRGFDVFLPADAESNVTLGLPLRPVEVLKVAHHGSEDEGLRSLLDRLEPQLAVIEVGQGNRYGHPHRQTLATLEASVPTVLRTDRDGDVKITFGRAGASLTTGRR